MIGPILNHTNNNILLCPIYYYYVNTKHINPICFIVTLVYVEGLKHVWVLLQTT